MRTLRCTFVNSVVLFFCINFVIAQTDAREDVFNPAQFIKTEPNEFGILEAVVIDSLTQKPVVDANVHVYISGGKEKYRYEVDEYGSFVIKTDANGIAGIKLPTGETGDIFPRNRDYYPPDRISFTIVKNKTTSITFNFVPMKFIGIVRDDTGKPVRGAKVLLTQVGQQVIESDSEGRFEIKWDMIFSTQPAASYLIARDSIRNLCAAERVKKPNQKFDLTLKHGLTLAGQVVDPNGNGINNIGIIVQLKDAEGLIGGQLYSTTRDSNTIQTSSDGKFEINAIPSDFMFNFFIITNEYGKASKRDISSSDAINSYLDAGTFVLPFLDHSVSGIVVDFDGKSVPDAKVHLYAGMQPDRTVQTDKDGRFIIEKIGPGKFSLQARKSGQKDLVGDVDTQADETNVMIVVSGDRFARTETIKPSSLTGKKLPDINDLSFDKKLPDLDNKIILLCFFDFEQRPSRNCILELNKKTHELKGKNVEVILIQAAKIEKESLDKWLKENNISFFNGMIESDEEQTRFNWGVKALPWLILTNKEHVVTAEGFSVTELDNKL